MSIYESALLSKQAYSNIEGAQFISSKEEDTQLYILKKEEDTLYVVFRGTSSIKDVLVDLKISRVRMRKNIKVHSGFYNQFKSVELEITKRLIKEENIKKIFFTGHSLGGALAQIAAAYYSDIFDFAHVVCHTFGSPRVGNRYFVEWFSQNVDEYVRVINKKDPVPMIPSFHYWNHTPNCMVLYGDGKIKKDQKDIPWYKRIYKLVSNSNVHEHDCDEYIKRLSNEK